MRKGFTLLQFIVVVAIIMGVVAVIMTIMDAKMDKGRRIPVPRDNEGRIQLTETGFSADPQSGIVTYWVYRDTTTGKSIFCVKDSGCVVLPDKDTTK